MKSAIKKGFTLIELLIVIAILGVLAVVVLVAINPQEQLARTRDAGRTSSVTQLGHAMQAYATSHEGSYIVDNIATCTAAPNWAGCLVDSGEIATVPGPLTYNITATAGCATNNTDAGGEGFCYVDNGAAPPTHGLIFTRLESGSNTTRCDGSDAAHTGNAYVGFDSTVGRGGMFCSAADPAAPGVAFIN